jgi:hypothetical protein
MASLFVYGFVHIIIISLSTSQLLWLFMAIFFMALWLQMQLFLAAFAERNNTSGTNF